MSSLIRFNQGRTFLLDGREVSVVRVINGDLVTLRRPPNLSSTTL